MADPRHDYADAPPPWAAAPAEDPTGLRPCDRAHLAGWIGVFIALIIAGIGIGYGGVLRGGPTAGNLVVLALMGGAVCCYAFAGLYLIFQTLTDRPPTGALVLICNVMVVGPFLVPAILTVFGIVPGGLIVFMGTHGPAWTVWLFAVSFGLMAVIQAVILWRSGRRLLLFLRAWLDPTGGQWW
jgi:hypothetical protein